MKSVDTMTLSYTFFAAKAPKTAADTTARPATPKL